MKEATWKNMTQLVLPGLFLFGALAYMHGPGYVAFFQKKLLAYSMQRDSLLGPVKYHVRLKAGFTSENGDGCEVYVLTDKDQSKNEANNRQELILVDKWSRVVDRKLATDVGAVRSTHLSPQEGYAMLEVVRAVPENRRQAEILHYQVTGDQIAMIESETKDVRPDWEWHQGPPRRRHYSNDRRHRRWGDRRQPTPEQIEKWKQYHEEWKARHREREVAQGDRDRDEDRANRRRDRDRSDARTDEVTRSDNEKDVKRTRAVSSDDERLLDVSRLGRTGDEASKMVLAPN